jgi:hypothetical protein
MKIRVRYSAEEAAAHQLSYTVPAAGQSQSAGKQSVQTQPAIDLERKKKVNFIYRTYIHKKGKKTHVE